MDVGHRDCATKEFDAIVQVGHHFNVVDGGAAADTSQCQSVDFIGCTELSAAMANGDIAQDAAVVGVIVAPVLREVVVGGNPLDLSGPSKVGGRIAQDDDAAPLAAGVIGHGSVEGVTFKRENDGGLSSSVGYKLSAFGDNQGRSVDATSRGTLDDSSGFNGEGLSRFNKNISGEHSRCCWRSTWWCRCCQKR